MAEGYEKRIGVGAIVINADGKILLGIRDVDDNRGKWELLGGLVQDVDKTLEDAVKRETMEEAGIEVEPLVIVAHYTREFPERQIINFGFCFLSRLLSGEPHVTPHGRVAGFKWVRPEEALGLELTPFTRIQLQQFDSWINAIDELTL